MSKAILILDEMPESCMECRLKYLDTGDDAYFGPNVYCCVWDGSEILKRGKDEWCPLKPLPKSINEEKALAITNVNDHTYLNGVVDGFRICIDEILGEEND